MNKVLVTRYLQDGELYTQPYTTRYIWLEPDFKRDIFRRSALKENGIVANRFLRVTIIHIIAVSGITRSQKREKTFRQGR